MRGAGRVVLAVPRNAAHRVTRVSFRALVDVERPDPLGRPLPDRGVELDDLGRRIGGAPQHHVPVDQRVPEPLTSRTKKTCEVVGSDDGSITDA